MVVGGEVIGRDDPDYQEKIIEFTELLANGDANRVTSS
jgi:hypothetical protein